MEYLYNPQPGLGDYDRKSNVKKVRNQRKTTEDVWNTDLQVQHGYYMPEHTIAVITSTIFAHRLNLFPWGCVCQ